MTRERLRKQVLAKAEISAEERVIDALVGDNASKSSRDKFRIKLRSGELNGKEIEVEVSDTSNAGAPTLEIPGMPGAQVGMINLNDMLGNAMGNRKKIKKMNVSDSYDVLLKEESDKLLDEDVISREAIEATQNNGIVFIDEVDKIATRSEGRGGEVSREGVQRDLLPLIEGTTVATKYGPIKTDHILFIASGAFHLSKPSDLLPELQGRLPIRVELKALEKNDFIRILTETEASLIAQSKALLKTEDVTLEFSEEAIEAIAGLASEINKNIENIGARRLHTVIEKLLEDISFTATDRGGETINITPTVVDEQVGNLAKQGDLSKFIL
tara:strand:- start:65 stop:1048 length:984 start_codon:yes stop_codon:yes gene_type:complete